MEKWKNKTVGKAHLLGYAVQCNSGKTDGSQ